MQGKLPAVTVANGNIGRLGFVAGPQTYVIDTHALSDPLLARLPAIQDSHWRIGHFTRHLPKGYLETLNYGENKISDKNLADYYDKLTLITRGNLWDINRLVEIWKMNSGHYEHLINFKLYSSPHLD